MSCITEILKLKGYKEVFLPLNKNGKLIVAVEGGGTYKDYEYLIVLNRHGHRCGYVALPSDSKYNNVSTRTNMIDKSEDLNYDEVDVECHGGLTFMARDHSLKDILSQPCEDIWIGFDCGHHSDHCDVEAFRKYYGEEETKKKQSFFDDRNDNYYDHVGRVRPYEYAESECHSIIDQLIEKES